MGSMKIGIPDELMPSEAMRDAAKETDKFYQEIFNVLTTEGTEPKATATEAICIIAKVGAERVALAIGEGLNEYDKDLLQSIIERHIASVINIE